MEIKKQPRQSGKTTDIAKMLKKNRKAIAIVSTMRAKKYLCETFNIKEKKVFPLAYVLVNPGHINRETEIYIDEIGCCMDTILVGKIIYATHTDY